MGDPRDAYTKELLTAIPHLPLPGSLNATDERRMATHPLDEYIDAVANALGLPVQQAWKPAVKANLEVSLRLARLVDEFPLSDEIEPASVFAA